jgi:hypothetical protein
MILARPARGPAEPPIMIDSLTGTGEAAGVPLIVLMWAGPATRWSMTRVRLGVDRGDECSRATVFDAFVEQPKWSPLGNRWAHSLLGLAEHRYPDGAAS